MLDASQAALLVETEYMALLAAALGSHKPIRLGRALRGVGEPFRRGTFTG